MNFQNNNLTNIQLNPLNKGMTNKRIITINKILANQKNISLKICINIKNSQIANLIYIIQIRDLISLI